jgi:hypothetical protein
VKQKVKVLLQCLDLVGGFVMGSEHSRRRMQQEIMALMQRHNLPDFFITLNPGDLHSRLVLNFHGLKIDLESQFPGTEIPSLVERARIAANDPVACAKAFHCIITAILNDVLGYNTPEGGVLGHVKAYYGTVEETGKGTLHMHLLLWMFGGKNGRQVWPMIEQDPEFSDQVLEYMSQCIRLDYRPSPPLQFRSLSRKQTDTTSAQTGMGARAPLPQTRCVCVCVCVCMGM